MSDLQIDFGNSGSSGKSGGIGATIFLIVFATPFAGFGLLALVQGVRKWAAGDIKNGPVLCLFGLVFSLVGFGLMAGAVWGRKKLKQKAELEARFADRPWMVRQDWADGKIKSSTMNQPKIFLLMGLAFTGMGGVATYFGLPEVWQKHNYAALLVLLFPLVGIVMLLAFINAWRSQRRFGECFFEPAQIPVPLGGVLEGQIQTGKPLKLDHELNLKFSCIRRVVTGSGKSRSVNEYALWQSEKIYLEQAGLIEAEPGHTGIPVHFKLPADQPECYSRGDESVFWRLEAKSKMRGPGFHAIFDLPVFKVAGAATADEAGADNDPTAALEAPIEEIRREEHSRIQVTDGPNGREFYFPPARNVGAALFTTLAMLFFNGVAVGTHYLHAPVIFPIVFGLVGVLMILGTFSMWFKSSRVTIDSTAVRVINHWLIFSRTRQFPTGDIERFASRQGMQMGSQVFADIRLIPRGSDEKFAASPENSPDPKNVNQLMMARFRAAAGPSGVTVASNIASVAEADWLVAEMNQALRQTHPAAGSSPGEIMGAPGAGTGALKPALAVLVGIVLAGGLGYWFWQQAHSVPPASPPVESPKSVETPAAASPEPAQPQPAVLDVAFSSFGSNNESGADGWLVDTNGHADWFVSKASGRLRAIELKIEPAGGSAEKLVVSIWSDRGGVPGRALETFSVGRRASPNPLGRLVFNSRRQPALTAGAKYWIYAKTQGTWDWHFNGQNLMQDAMQSPQPRKWVGTGYTNVCAFSIVTERNPSSPPTP